ncbi:MAG: class I SAM-dependent methyltransferase [Proteobacteria bacterium]|nr:class I SAM-dependent methyltransferase [Pseudomonadota bacterium]
MKPPLSISVSCTIHSAIILQKAADLAKKLELPLVDHVSQCFSDLVLAYTPEGLKLIQLLPGSKSPQNLLFIDFVHGKNGYRLAKNCTIKQPVARAVGIKPGIRPNILDGTGGLGSDAFVLASLGCQVTVCERSPIISVLLEDGLQRALLDEKTAVIIKQRLRLVVADSRTYLQQCQEVYATVYLDPMYPHRHDSALNRQSMRTTRTLVGDDQDSGLLLEVALKRAENRVVVKRPIQAPLLTERIPSHTIATKNSRFDVYMTFNNPTP